MEKERLPTVDFGMEYRNRAVRPRPRNVLLLISPFSTSGCTASTMVNAGWIMYNEEAYTIYQQAEAFKLAYERCMMCINQNGAIILPIPAMVNSAFSVELFLKAVIKEKTSECRSHKLSDLFNRLPIEIQQEIMNETNHSDFETQIERFSDAFVDFRYIYEDIFKTKDLNLKFWEDFSSAIYKIVPTHIARKGAPLYIDPSIK